MLVVLSVVVGCCVSAGFGSGVGWYGCFVSLCVASFFSVFMLESWGWGTSELFFTVDWVGSGLVVLSVWISVLMLLASVRVWINDLSPSHFLFLVVSLCGVLVGCFGVSDMLSFYVLFEASLVPTLFLILGWGYQPERMQASFYMMFYTVSASLPLLLVILVYRSVKGSCCFFLEWEAVMCMGLYSFFLWACLVFAFLVKLPVFFVHLWLPKAHVEAPVAGSMVLAAILLKLGGYGVLRVSFLFPSLMSAFSDFFMVFVLWGSVFTAFICLRQTDLKSLIAYSSVGHMGIFIAGVMSGNSWGWQGGVLMMLAHGLCSSSLFNLANVSYESVGSRSGYLSKGVICFFPSLTFLWFLFCSANMAAPPFLGLPSEIFLIVSILGSSWYNFFVLGLLSFLGGAYSLYLFTALHHGKSLSGYGALFSQRMVQFVCSFFHLFPLIFLILKMGAVVG